MTAPYAGARVWVHIRPFSSVVNLLDVESREKGGDYNKNHGIG